MPTGYTAKLHDDVQTFDEFVMECARAFGALIELRDSPTAAIPDEILPSTYHSEALLKAKMRRAEVDQMTTDECAAEAALVATKVEQDIQASNGRIYQRQHRYESMLAAVRAWTPPTSNHEGLKLFMEQQLEESIKFDCSEITRPTMTRSGEQWRANELAKADRDILHHEAEWTKDVERAAERTAWIRALRASLETDDG